MDDQNKNLILATALSFLVIMLWFVMFPPPETPAVDPATTNAESGASHGTVVSAPTAGGTTPTDGTAAATTQTEVAEAPRLPIDTPSLSGTISLQGGRIDQLSLKNYHETLQPDSAIVDLLSPVGSETPYYALFGWAPGAGLAADDTPNGNTLWQAESEGPLTPQSPVALTWQNGAGLTFRRVIAVDEDYIFTVTQSVENTGETPVSLAPYGVLARHGVPTGMKNFFILHEGLISMSDGELSEVDYKDVAKYDVNPREGAQAKVTQVEQNGWTGFTDHYWMTTLIPAPDSAFKSVKKFDVARNIYQTETVMPTQTVQPGAEVSVQTRLFVGAKEWETIRRYQNEGGVDRFLDSIDWGWFFFLTKPIFAVLHYLNATLAGMGVAGSMGWSIIGLTLLIKALLLPLAYKSYVSMAKMKELQPQMEKIKESAKDDRQKLQKEMMELYKREKVNPASGCLPILLQIPIFFSLYKVIFVTLELRHAPWVGWIKDLSAPDPSSLFNLWGLFPWDAPEAGSILALLFIGILPLLLGISMWLQQKLNPAPTDPTQQMIFAWMPWVFMFMLGSFASGLVLYWIANNTITFAQQYLIMRSQGYRPDVFGNMMSSFRKRPREGKK